MTTSILCSVCGATAEMCEHYGPRLAAQNREMMERIEAAEWKRRAEAAEAALSRAREVMGAARKAVAAFLRWSRTPDCILDPETIDAMHELRAALAAAPDPSPVAGRDDEKKLTSEDRTDGD